LSRSIWLQRRSTSSAAPQPVPVGNQDHGRVPVAMAVALHGIDQCLDLVGREVFAGPQVGVGTAPRHNCPIYDGCPHYLQVRFSHENFPLQSNNCQNNTRNTDSKQATVKPCKLELGSGQPSGPRAHAC
jgi:hypothetical protein